jgi:hypothetical protein
MNQLDVAEILTHNVGLIWLIFQTALIRFSNITPSRSMAHFLQSRAVVGVKNILRIDVNCSTLMSRLAWIW